MASLWLVSLAWTALHAADAPAPQAATSQTLAQVAPPAPAPATSTADAPRAAEPHRQVVTRYCVTCHNQRLKTGNLALDGMDWASIPRDGDVWEKVVRKLRTGAMPPQGAPKPAGTATDDLAAWLETELDRAAAAQPHPGPPLVRRLNRTEYAAAVHDLLALDVDAASLLPPDDSAYGFDNISDALKVSPALQERYLSAAEKISGLAVGEPGIPAVSESYRVRGDVSQNQHLEGLPLGTVGGMRVRHTFPLDGEYALRVEIFRTNFDNPKGIEHPHEFQITVDGDRVHETRIGGAADLSAAFETPKETADAIDARMGTRVRVTAGPHDVVAAFVGHLPGEDTTRLRPFLKSAFDTLDWTGRPAIRMLTITGPYNAGSAGDTPSRTRIFTCRPAAGASSAEETACARQILSMLARRAYRQPVGEQDLAPLMKLYALGRQERGFEGGIQAALQLLLASPRFAFRIERDPPGVAPGRAYRVSDVELASRLSFFLWSSLPDDELLDAAARGRLRTPAGLEQQLRRMLADNRSQALVSNFAGQWLHLRNVRNVQPNSDTFPDFDDNLRQAFAREAELFFGSILREDRSILDLMTADHTFVNERLARHYGMPNVYGSHFRRVTLTDEARFGLLGKGGILALTSIATRTSPVQRGKWILENILGTPPAPPPPDVPALKEPEKGARPKTMREQMAEHRANPVCASCHRVMDPLGFALENFDAVGAWRTDDHGIAIDASSELADGSKVANVIELRRALVKRPDVFAGTVTEKLLTYALGRGLDHHDMPVVRGIVHEAARNGYRFSSLVMGVVESVPFQMRVRSDTPAPAVAAR